MNIAHELTDAAAFLDHVLRDGALRFRRLHQGPHVVLGSATGGPLSALLWAMYADTADYGEWRNGRRATGLVFSASTMSQKFGWAIGASLAVWLLSAVGFRANVAPSPAVRHGLVLLVSLIPAGLGVVSLLPLLAYKLDEATMDKIGHELQERRAALASPGS